MEQKVYRRVLMEKGIGIEFVEKRKGEEIAQTIARITVPAIPDLLCDLWCYEDKFGVGEGHPQADGSMILKHRHADNPQIDTNTTLRRGYSDTFLFGRSIRGSRKQAGE
jgi:hypothetical protein